MRVPIRTTEPKASDPIKAVLLNCTLKRSPEPSNTEGLARVLATALDEHGVETEMIRLVDYKISFGTTTDEGGGDQWPAIAAKLLDAEILVIGSPTWIGQPSAVAKLALERMNAMIGQTDAGGLPVAFNKVAAVVCTGTEDGAHHVIMEIAGALGDIGYTIPGQAWAYWNKGPGPGPDYLETDEGHEWAAGVARTAAQNLVAVAGALAENPIPPTPEG